MKKVILFILLWGTWGFALGTLVLLGPNRWVVTYARDNNYSPKTENVLVMICIAGLIIFSALIARRSSGFIVRSTNKPLNFLLVAIPVIGACLALYAFMTPKLMNKGSKEEIIGKNFTIGAYPELIKLKELKSQGYTAVISLLHPGVIPFESLLIAQEQKDAKMVGIELILLPMLPWIDDNLSSIDSLKKIVAMAKGKYYIHCYLGKDRVNVARRVIEEEHENVKLENKSFLSRNLDSVKRFERGPIIKLNDSVYFTPMPTKEEYFGYILAGNFKQIVSLADTTNADAKKIIKKEEKTVKAFNIKFKVFRVNETTTALALKKIVKDVKALPKPLIIHSFFSDSKEAKMFLEAYNNQ